MSDEDNELTSEDQSEGTIKDKVEDQVEELTDNIDGKTTKKKCRGRSFVLIFLILIGGLTGSGYYLWKELQQTRADLDEVGNNLQAQSGLTTGNIVAMEDAIRQLQQKQSEQSDALASLYREIQGIMKTGPLRRSSTC